MGLVHELLGPTIAPQNPSIRIPGWKGGFWQTRALHMAHLVGPRIYVSGFPGSQAVFKGFRLIRSESTPAAWMSQTRP